MKKMPPKLEQGSPTDRMQLVLPRSLVERVDEWRATVRPIPNRSEAIRMLLDSALPPVDDQQSSAKEL